MSTRMQIVIVSEVSVGYGTPQVLRVAQSMAERFNADVLILEPDQPERPSVNLRDHAADERVSLERIFTTSHPYSSAGRIEFTLIAAQILDRLRPRIVLFGSAYGLPVLLRANAPNQLNIFYCLENVDANPPAELRHLARRCSIIVFPEANRARLYSERLGGLAPDQEAMIVYNANYPRAPAPPQRRLRRIFYGGTFHKDLTCGDYFIDPDLAHLPIDIYGLIDGYPDKKKIAAQLNGARGGVKYCGYREADASFFALMARYQYSIVIWNPIKEALRYAAPNKLFDAIACGVPPICAPHPQCVEIIDKWRCGLLMEDFSYSALRTRLKQALRMIGSREHAEMVRNCATAMEQGMNWPYQFEKLAAAIQRRL